MTPRALLVLAVVVNGCECRPRSQEQQPVVAVRAPAPRPVVAAAGSAGSNAPKLALPLREHTTVCDLVGVAEVASVSGLSVDRGFPKTDVNASSCVYVSDADPQAAGITVAIAAQPDLSNAQRDMPTGTRLAGLAEDNWYVEQADEDASVLYVQDGDTQLTVAVDNRLPADRRATIAERIARLALAHR